MPGYAQIGTLNPVNNIVIPPEGSKVLDVALDFTNQSTIDLQGFLAVALGKVQYLQGVFVDNSANSAPLTLRAAATNQTLVVPAQSQGYYPFFLSQTPDCVASTTQAAITVTLNFYNMPMQAMQWKTGGETTPVGGAWSNRSIANLSGASEQLMAANTTRRHLFIQNIAANNMGVNLAGGAAAIGTAGTITLSPGSALEIYDYPPVSAITIIGTANDDVTAYEG